MARGCSSALRTSHFFCIGKCVLLCASITRSWTLSYTQMASFLVFGSLLDLKLITVSFPRDLNWSLVRVSSVSM